MGMRSPVAIGAAFRAKRPLHMTNLRTEAHKHRLENGIAADEEPPLPDLGWRMAIAHMPGQARKGRTCRSHLCQGLDSRADFNVSPIAQDECGAILEFRRVGEVKHDLFAIVGREKAASPVPLGMRKGEG